MIRLPLATLFRGRPIEPVTQTEHINYLQLHSCRTRTSAAQTRPWAVNRRRIIHGSKLYTVCEHSNHVCDERKMAPSSTTKSREYDEMLA